MSHIVYDYFLWTSVNIIGITRILNPYIGTEKEMKRKVAEFAACLKQAKEKSLLDQPRQRKPTEKALQLERKEDSEEEEIIKQPVQNVPIENKDTAKPKNTNKRKASTDKDNTKKQSQKQKSPSQMMPNWQLQKRLRCGYSTAGRTMKLKLPIWTKRTMT